MHFFNTLGDKRHVSRAADPRTVVEVPKEREVLPLEKNVILEGRLTPDTKRETRPTTTRLHTHVHRNLLRKHSFRSLVLSATSTVWPDLTLSSSAGSLHRRPFFGFVRIPDIAKRLAGPAPPLATHAHRYHREMLHSTCT